MGLGARFSLGDVQVELVWFDSLGAKASCVLVRSPYVNLIIDPGVAIMHPSFPADWEDKVRWVEEGYSEVLRAAGEADVVIITHYHYDHFTDFDRRLYEGKLLIIKDPNTFINESQRGRVVNFLTNLLSEFGGPDLEELLKPPEVRSFRNPMDGLKLATSKDFGNYSRRRAELLRKGLKWFENLSRKWVSRGWVREFKLGDVVEVRFGDGREFKFGDLRVSLSGPRFHGIEFSRVGWVTSVVIRCCGYVIYYTSDLNGPIVEDYAEDIIKVGPDLLILDGPPTYLLGYTMNKTNLERAVENAVRILKELPEGTNIVYDHHLPRERRYRERTKKVWETAKKLKNKTIKTAAEYQGKKPAVLALKK